MYKIVNRTLSLLVYGFALLAVNSLSPNLQAQSFKSRIIAGINASQIRGDELSGFNKLGLSGGLGLAFPLSDRWTLNMELLYSERGSKSKPLPDNSNPETKFVLNYASIPLFITFNDWVAEWDGESYYKLHFEAGLNYGRLVKSEINDWQPGQNPDVDALQDAFQQNDLSWMVGFSLDFNPKWGTSVRYTRSIIPIFKPQRDGPIYKHSLLPFFLTFHLYYHL